MLNYAIYFPKIANNYLTNDEWIKINITIIYKLVIGSYDVVKESKGGSRYSMGGEKRFKHKKGNYEPGNKQK